MENDFLRQKREREFQERIIASLEKPKGNRFWAFINSAIFIWFLSATVLAMGGGYITNHQQCLHDAEQIIDRRARLGLELAGRQRAFNDTVQQAKTQKDAPFGPGIKGSVYDDLSKMSYFEVSNEFLKLEGRVERVQFPDGDEIHQARMKWMEFNRALADKMFDEAQKPILGNGPPTDKAQQAKDFKMQQLMTQLNFEIMSFDRDIDNYAYSLEPNCNLIFVGASVLGYKPPIVLASISPLYQLGSGFSEIFQDRKESIEKLQAQVRASGGLDKAN